MGVNNEIAKINWRKLKFILFPRTTCTMSQPNLAQSILGRRRFNLVFTNKKHSILKTRYSLLSESTLVGIIVALLCLMIITFSQVSNVWSMGLLLLKKEIICCFIRNINKMCSPVYISTYHICFNLNTYIRFLHACHINNTRPEYFICMYAIVKWWWE